MVDIQPNTRAPTGSCEIELHVFTEGQDLAYKSFESAREQFLPGMRVFRNDPGMDAAPSIIVQTGSDRLDVKTLFEIASPWGIDSGESDAIPAFITVVANAKSLEDEYAEIDLVIELETPEPPNVVQEEASMAIGGKEVMGVGEMFGRREFKTYKIPNVEYEKARWIHQTANALGRQLPVSRTYLDCHPPKSDVM